ncbi:TetR/AcrR family transcriptional regulator [Leucobacter musarum]|uniref:TetR/AcrR family transcriptional regulator n=1 Tax=Leucobacter musarum TaxID=1930747 RepID=UPI0006A7E35F|nr:TetR family transcriptional regulator [Leucobacter musarum]
MSGSGSQEHAERTVRSGERRDIIIAAALDTIIERGVHGTSHRVVADRAGVPLGSMTYYFSGFTEVLEEAFSLLQQRITAEHRELLAAATSSDAAIAAIVALISGDRGPSPAQMRGLAEMYAYANHNVRVAELSRDWLCVTAETLAAHFSSDVAAGIDALVEGWNLHRAFVGAPPNAAIVERAVRGLVGAD